MSKNERETEVEHAREEGQTDRQREAEVGRGQNDTVL